MLSAAAAALLTAVMTAVAARADTTVTPTTLSAVTLTGAVAATQQSALIVQGDGSAAFLLAQDTKITSNIFLGGGGIVQTSTVNSTASNSIRVGVGGSVDGNRSWQRCL